MSVAFASARPRGKGEVTQQTIQKVGMAEGVQSAGGRGARTKPGHSPPHGALTAAPRAPRKACANFAGGTGSGGPAAAGGGDPGARCAFFSQSAPGSRRNRARRQGPRPLQPGRGLVALC